MSDTSPGCEELAKLLSRASTYILNKKYICEQKAELHKEVQPVIQRHFASIAELIALTILSETEGMQDAEHISSEETEGTEGIEEEIAREWYALQQVPSYIEELLETNRGLIEGIATQN